MAQDFSPSDQNLLQRLPRDLSVLVFLHLEARDVASLSIVSKAWKQTSDTELVWVALRRRDFPSAAPAASVLDQRARRLASNRGGDSPPLSAAKLVYCWLAAQHTCDRCKQPFCDGTNGPESCTFHPGVLFSGGVLNGNGLRYTCCNRRAHHIPNGSRDANGCKASHHISASGLSAWEADRNGAAKPRLNLSSSSTSAASSCVFGSGIGSSDSGSRASSPTAQEWHPNERRAWGVIEMPSRLLQDL